MLLDQKIIYLIETYKYKHKIYEIYLNYTPRKYVNYLPIDLEKIIYSLIGGLKSSMGYLGAKH